MWKLLDRQMFLSYLKAYLVCMVSLLGLFIVVDLFMNLDDFTHNTPDFPSLVKYVGTYYAYNTLKVFNSISEAIVLLAAMFTVGMMQRNNELLPLLSAGVSTRRVVLPVLIGAICVLTLTTLNQEFLLPHVDAFLVENRGDPTGEKETPVAGAFDPSGIIISGKRAVKKGMLIKDFICTFTPDVSNQTITPLQAKEARYIPPEPGNKHSGGWLLTSTSGPDLEGWTRDDLLEMIVPGQFFLHTSPEIDFERVTRLNNWHVYTPTWKLLRELSRDVRQAGQRGRAVSHAFDQAVPGHDPGRSRPVRDPGRAESQYLHQCWPVSGAVRPVLRVVLHLPGPGQRRNAVARPGRLPAGPRLRPPGNRHVF